MLKMQHYSGFTTLWANWADEKLMIILFLVYWIWHLMQISSMWDNFMKCQNMFSSVNMKRINMSPAGIFTQSAKR